MVNILEIRCIHFQFFEILKNNFVQLNFLLKLVRFLDAETTALKRCNSKWTTLTKNLRKKLEDTEKIWLEQKSFAEKCQYWVDFVREASFRLKEAQSYVGSYEGFKQCYKNLQDLTNELVGKQPVMNSIMSEGRKLMFYEDETEIYSNQLERRIEETKEEWKQTVQFLDEEKTRTTQVRSYLWISLVKYFEGREFLDYPRTDLISCYLLLTKGIIMTYYNRDCDFEVFLMPRFWRSGLISSQIWAEWPNGWETLLTS